MEKIQRDKRSYCIAGIVGILGLFLLIGVWPNYSEHEVKNDKAYLAVSNIQQGESPTTRSPANDLSQPKQCAINVNAIYSLVLLGVGWWLKRDQPRQLKLYYKEYWETRDKNASALHLEYLHYILFTVVLLAMLGYMGYFFYQHYSLDSTCAKDMAILFVGMPCLYLFIMDILIYIIKDKLKVKLEPGAKSKSKSKYLLIGFLASNVIYYYLGRWLLKGFLSNHKLVLLKQVRSFDMQWFYAACMLAYLYYQIHIQGNKYKGFIVRWLLWCLPVAFLCTQAYWSPQLCFSFGHEKIDCLIAWPFQTINVWIVLGLVVLYDVIGSEKLDWNKLLWPTSHQTPQ